MVIVATGPAHSGLERVPANSVGSQFFVAQPGRDVEAKKKRMAQKAMFEKMRPKDLRSDALDPTDEPWDDDTAPSVESLFSFRKTISTKA